MHGDALPHRETLREHGERRDAGTGGHRGSPSLPPPKINTKKSKGQLPRQEKAPLRERSCFSEGIRASQVSKNLSEALWAQILGNFTVTSLPSVTEGDFNTNIMPIIVLYGSVLLGGQEESPELHNWPETTFVLPPSLSSYSSRRTGIWGISALVTVIRPRFSSSSLPTELLSKCPSPAAVALVPRAARPPAACGPTRSRAQPQLLSKTRVSSLRGCSTQLRKSQPPRNLRADPKGLFSLRCLGPLATGRRGEKKKKSQQGACPSCCDMPRALLCYNQNSPALTAIMLQHRAYVVLLNFCLAINQPSQFPSNILSGGHVPQRNSLSCEF